MVNYLSRGGGPAHSDDSGQIGGGRHQGLRLVGRPVAAGPAAGPPARGSGLPGGPARLEGGLRGLVPEAASHQAVSHLLLWQRSAG